MPLSVLAQYALPQHLISQAMGYFANTSGAIGQRAFTNWFVRRFGVDMAEAAQPDPHAYATFNDFFTRALKPGVRPMLAGPTELASPVDGAVSELGTVRQGCIIQAKGHDYSVAALLADAAAAAAFDGGDFCTIYLAPNDYHRIHMPCDGRLLRTLHVPGKLFSVNPLTAAHVPKLFARNERVVCHFATAQGPLAMVLVGAMVVGSIETVTQGVITPPTTRTVRELPEVGRAFVKGEELGRFRLGSTVVMLSAPGAWRYHPTWAPRRKVRLHEVMAQMA